MKSLKKILLSLIAITITSCTTSSNSTPAPVTPPATAAGFTWTENGNSTILTVDNPYANAQYNSIFAVRTGTTIYEINLTSLSPGTYSLSGTGNSMFYNNNANPMANFSSTGGSVAITSNSNNKLSGTFTATGSGNGVTSVSGQFTDIVIKP